MIVNNDVDDVDAVENLGETEVREALLAKAEYYSKIGAKVSLVGFDDLTIRRRLRRHSVRLTKRHRRWDSAWTFSSISSALVWRRFHVSRLFVSSFCEGFWPRALLRLFTHRILLL